MAGEKSIIVELWVGACTWGMSFSSVGIGAGMVIILIGKRANNRDGDPLDGGNVQVFRNLKTSRIVSEI